MKLSDQVEAATGADRELDALIAVATGGGYVDPDAPQSVKAHDTTGDWFVVVGSPPLDFYSPRRYSASIDAALTLVPEAWQMIDGQDVPERSFRRLTLNKGGFSPYFQGLAATPALALCAAALRARRL